MNNLRFAFLGATNYSKNLLKFLISKNLVPKLIFSIPETFTISYSKEKVCNTNYANLKEIADEYSIPFYEVDSVSGKKITYYENVLCNENLDLILVLGWFYMVPEKIRNIPKYGAWAIHSSMLPKYAGGAPLTWAIINGETKTGVTLFKLDSGVDDGDIIAQQEFAILYEDSIAEVYAKATEASKNVLRKVLMQEKLDFNFIPQDKKAVEIYPQRSPKDGEIDLTRSSEDIYNFIRAQSSPYPGAFIRMKDGKKLIIEQARVE